MVEYKNKTLLSEILKAVSDTTRRSLLTQLCQQGPSRVTDLANYYDMSLNAVSKHIKILEKAGLIKRSQIGRTHWIEADLEVFAEARDWFDELQSIWNLRLTKLDDLLSDNLLNDNVLSDNVLSNGEQKND
jgi:DNA-binding transcriptional ArsR family regulator